MFRVWVPATQKEMAVITRAARSLGLSAPQFVTRLIKKLSRNLKTPKISPRRGSLGRQKSLRRKPKP